MKIFWKIFGLKFGMTQKNFCLDLHPKNSESSVLGKGKNSETFLTSNLVWSKKLALTPLLKIESRAYSKEKNSENFLTSNLV